MFLRDDFKFLDVEQILQKHVVAWEKAARGLKTEDAKPHLNKILEVLQSIKITEKPELIVSLMPALADSLHGAIEIIETNESLTMSSNRGVMVKAGIMVGWITEPELTIADVDDMHAGLVQWLAEQIAERYGKATEIPKN